MKKFGEMLISRPAGREAYLAMKAYITRDVPKNEPIEIDFEGVKVLTPSFADEIVTKLVEEFDTVKFLHTEKNSTVRLTLQTLQEYSGLSKTGSEKVG